MVNRITKIQQVLTVGGKNRETLHVAHVAQKISRAISAADKRNLTKLHDEARSLN